MDTYTLHRGTAPLLISLPHDGSDIPATLAARMTASAQRAPDTDWFVSRLYEFGKSLGASMLVPRFSRYVVDLNRPPDDVSLYPGQNTTGLCPIVQFSGEPVYLEGQLPDEREIAGRIETYWQPFHTALENELQRIRGEHGRVLLWEGHSIRGRLPFLFEGRLPDFNVGTVNGTSCLPRTQTAIESMLSEQTDYSWISNGRFKGGYNTRHYGRPTQGIEAVQLELVQSNYMDEDAVSYYERLAAPTQALIVKLMRAALPELI
jgi:N-formylglutamate deformylase